MTPEELGQQFEKEFGTKSDYFNHRLGLFMEMKKWCIQKAKEYANAKLDEAAEKALNNIIPGHSVQEPSMLNIHKEILNIKDK